jgi:hypothetical protein
LCCVFLRKILTNYLPKQPLNLNLPDLCLPSS